jgi:flagellar biogenesis protein FliO
MAMDLLPLWIWPVAVCGLALMLRLVLPGGRPRGVQPGSNLPLAGTSRIDPVGWLRRKLAGGKANASEEPVCVLGRKVIGPQQSVLLLRVWDEELAVCLQPGSPATVLARRGPDRQQHTSLTNEPNRIRHAQSALSEAPMPEAAMTPATGGDSFRRILEQRCG